jgi:AcrR family transcriptional regulator
MAPPTTAADTSDRILAVAVALFTERGYAGTSIRDIAERLGITKAAVYYHFPAKDQILDALVEPIFDRIDTLAARAGDLTPREIVDELVAILAGPGAVLRACMQDPSAMREIAQRRAVPARMERVLAGLAGPDAGPERRVRARCALGAIHAGVVGKHGERAPAPLTPELRRTVAQAALAALGD